MELQRRGASPRRRHAVEHHPLPDLARAHARPRRQRPLRLRHALRQRQRRPARGPVRARRRLQRRPAELQGLPGALAGQGRAAVRRRARRRRASAARQRGWRGEGVQRRGEAVDLRPALVGRRLGRHEELGIAVERVGDGAGAADAAGERREWGAWDGGRGELGAGARWRRVRGPGSRVGLRAAAGDGL